MNETSEEKKIKLEETVRLLITVMNGTGLIMILFGVFCLIDPTLIGDFAGFSVDTIQIMAFTLIITGLGIIATPFIEKFKKNSRRP